MNLALAHHPLRTTRVRRSATFNVIVAALAVAPVLGCGSSNSPSHSAAANILLTNANNYSSTSSLTLDSVTTSSGKELTIDWTAVAKDLQCHDLNPLTTIKNIALVWLPNMTHADAQAKLISGNLDLDTVGAYCEYNTNGTASNAKTSAMSCLTGDSRLPAQNAADSYVAIASKSLTPGAGAQSMIFVTPTADSQATTVTIPTGCNELAFNADLGTLTKVPVSTKSPWVVDWSQVTKDSEKKAITWAKYDGYDLILGYYDISVSELQTRFFDVDILPKKIWRIKNISTSSSAEMVKDLTKAQAADGSLFTGFDPQDALWVLGLQCPDCQNPAPMFFTILDTSGAAQ